MLNLESAGLITPVSSEHIKRSQKSGNKPVQNHEANHVGTGCAADTANTANLRSYIWRVRKVIASFLKSEIDRVEADNG